MEIKEITGTIIFLYSNDRDMDAPSINNASLDPPVATDMWVEEDEASADGNSQTES